MDAFGIRIRVSFKIPELVTTTSRAKSLSWDQLNMPDDHLAQLRRQAIDV